MNQNYSDRILDGIDAHRVAEIIAESSDSAPARRGSGYRVTDESVLTARHVVQGAQLVSVRFDADSPGEWVAVAVDWTSVGDMAILRLADLPANAPETDPASYGRLTETAAVVEIHTAGFPRFKLREDQDPPTASDTVTRYRDFHHAIGWSAVLSNRREGTLEVTVSPPEREPGACSSSPWEGMSGAAVWVAGRIVGLVSAHDGSDGLGRLTVTRVDKTLDTVPAGMRNELRGLLGIQSDGTLVDVTPGIPSQSLVSAYQEQVRDMAPLGDLLDRNEELDKLVQFCASDDGYFWWQGGPWAGKTALMAWFATHLPAGIDAVSFFVTRRLSGQADSDAFTDVLIDQLSAITDQPVPPVLTPAARDGLRRRLLRDAAEKSRAAGRRLVLFVDGLDEDTAARRGSDRPSIASLLPKQLLFGMKVVVASRSHPPIPTDVAADHPLRGWPVHLLSDSPHARDIKDQAVWELDRLLTSDQIERDIVGFITASGDGLTAHDLNELTGQPPFVVDQILDSAFGRSVRTRLGRFNDQGGSRAYTFAHETLQFTAEDRIGAVLLNEYRDKINVWADGYRDRGWPLGTPRFLLGGYARMLEHALDIQRLVACVTDSKRHARLFAVMGGDAISLSEIRAAQNLILDQVVPDLESMARLSVHRAHLYERNWYLPDNLPLVWAALGEDFRAEALVRTIADPERQAQTLTELVTIMAEAGNHDRAEAVAQTIAVVEHQAEALAELATIIARAGDQDRAEALVRTIADPEQQAQTLTELVTIMAEAGNHDRAEALARTIAVVERRAQALVELSTVIAEAGDYDRAETIVRGVSSAFWKAQGLTALAGVAAQAGERNRCALLVEGIESVVAAIFDPEERDQVLSDLAGAAAQAGDHRRAEILARSISQSHWRTQALVELATLAGQAGDFHSAESLVACMPSSESQVELLTDLVVVAGQKGNRERGRHFIDVSRDLVQRIPDPDRRVRAFSDLAIATARAGDHSRAEAMALAISDPGRQARALVTCATVIAAYTGELGQAEGLIRSITDVERRAQGLFNLAAAAAQAGEAQLAGRLADDAEALARSITDPERRAQALTDLATASAQAGEAQLAGRLADDAEALARSITDPERRAQALTDLATASAQAGEFGRAEDLIHSIADPERRAQSLTDLATAAAQANDLARARSFVESAETLVGGIADPDRKTNMLTALASVSARTGDHIQVERLANRVEEVTRTIAVVERRAQALVELSTVIAEAGDYDRAETIVRGVSSAFWKAQGLTALAGVAAQAGERNRCALLVEGTESVVAAIFDPEERDQVLSDLAGAAAQAGDHRRAEILARSISQSHWRTQALVELATLAGQAGDFHSAETLAHSITDADWRAQVMAELAGVAAQYGSREEARHLLEASEALLGTLNAPDILVQVHAALAAAAAFIDDHQWASRLSSTGEALARGIGDPDRKAQVLCDLAGGAARAGDHDRAEALAKSITASHWQAQALASVATAHVDQVSQRNQRGMRNIYRLLAQSLSAADWNVSLTPLAQVSASAVVALAEEYESTVLHSASLGE